MEKQLIIGSFSTKNIQKIRISNKQIVEKKKREYVLGLSNISFG